MGGLKRVIQAAALSGLLLTCACHRAIEDSKAVAGTVVPKKRKPPLPRPSPTAHLIELPDSAIFVERGSTEEKLAAFLASDQPAPRTFRFAGAQFEPWQSNPNPATLRTMYAIAQILRAYPHAMVDITGHTDNVGTPAQNIALSQARVDRMAALLVHGGILPRRITAEGRGMADPIADNGTDAGKASNRRIELIITAK
jgi:outer membrane protein OmpA-like peptidoglycan-associated protein